MYEKIDLDELIIIRAVESPRKPNPLRKLLALFNAMYLGRNIRWRKGLVLSTSIVIHKYYNVPLLIYQELPKSVLYAIGIPELALYIAKLLNYKYIVFPEVFPYKELNEVVKRTQFEDEELKRITGVIVVTPEMLLNQLPHLSRITKRRSKIKISSRDIIENILGYKLLYRKSSNLNE